MVKLRSPFFTVNPKSYLWGEKSLQLALAADELAEKYDLDILFTAQAVDMRLLKARTKKIILTAQHLDGIKPGRGMGHILPEGLAEAGVQAVFLNHAEYPLTSAEIAAAVIRAKEVQILTLVCASTVQETRMLAALKPDVMLCEPTELIGSGKVSDLSYIKSTNAVVKEISPETLVLQAAGISTPEDVYNTILAGADGTGATSGIVCAQDPFAALNRMAEALVKARTQRTKNL